MAGHQTHHLHAGTDGQQSIAELTCQKHVQVPSNVYVCSSCVCARVSVFTNINIANILLANNKVTLRTTDQSFNSAVSRSAGLRGEVTDQGAPRCGPMAG